MTDGVMREDNMDKEIEQRFGVLEKRVAALEDKPKIMKPSEQAENFGGLAGGIRRLVRDGFLNTPKAVKEIENELKREGYHYAYKSIDKRLRDLVKNRNLTRIDDKGVWKYALRK